MTSHDYRISPVPSAGWKECLTWIHAELPGAEMDALVEDALLKLLSADAQLPLEARLGGERLACAYFKTLAGGVATLGGVKALDGFEAIGVDLVKQLHRQLLAVSIHQVQAIVSASDRVTPTILANSGFRLLTVVHHLWLELALSNSKFNDNASTFSSSTVHWLAASHVAKTRMAKLVESTFHQTLDCPELNGLRTPDDVLDGFLDGRTYREQYLWEILRVDDQDAGCLLLSAHGGNVAELVYMGLKPEMRGRGLGDHMVQRGITTAQRMGMNLLVVAVDQGNWPAIANYRRAGFQSHQSLSVWLAHGPD